MISYDDIREVNVKLTNAKYNDEILKRMSVVHSYDSLQISALGRELRLQQEVNRELKKERTVAFGIASAAVLGLILNLFK